MRVALCACVMVGILSAAAFPGMNADHKVAVHVMPYGHRGCNSSFPALEGCGDVRTTYEGCGDIHFFPVFYGLVELQGYEFDVTWPAGWGSCAYIFCAGDLFTGNITWPGDGVSAAWIECQQVTTVIAGFGWLTADTPGRIELLPWYDGWGILGVGECADLGGFDRPKCVFNAGVCGLIGDDPCGPTQTDSHVWGDIKALFK